MLSLYDETNGDNWTIKDRWLTDSDHCTWFGVMCDQEGFITKLDLASNNLNGSIPSRLLSKFYHLQELDLSDNHLIGSLDVFSIVEGSSVYVGDGYCNDIDGEYFSFLRSTESRSSLSPEDCRETCQRLFSHDSGLVGFEISSSCDCIFSRDNLPEDELEGFERAASRKKQGETVAKTVLEFKGQRIRSIRRWLRKCPKQI